MIVYEFPIKNFTASTGYASIRVIDGKLELFEKPNKLVLALIENSNGKEVIEDNKVKPKRKRKEAN